MLGMPRLELQLSTLGVKRMSVDNQGNRIRPSQEELVRARDSLKQVLLSQPLASSRTNLFDGLRESTYNKKRAGLSSELKSKDLGR